MGNFGTRRQTGPESMANRHTPGHAGGMGNHTARGSSPIIIPTTGIRMITFQVWSVMHQSQMAAYATYEREEGQKSFNIGGHLLDYDVLHLPSLGQTVFSIGDEIRMAWRELSHPKQ